MQAVFPEDFPESNDMYLSDKHTRRHLYVQQHNDRTYSVTLVPSVVPRHYCEFTFMSETYTN